MIKDPECALLTLICAVEASAARLSAGDEYEVLVTACHNARQHLRVPFFDKPADVDIAARAQRLRAAATIHLTQPIQETDIAAILKRDAKVVDLFPAPAEDRIARAVRMAKQLKRPVNG